MTGPRSFTTCASKLQWTSPEVSGFAEGTSSEVRYFRISGEAHYRWRHCVALPLVIFTSRQRPSMLSNFPSRATRALIVMCFIASAAIASVSKPLSAHEFGGTWKGRWKADASESRRAHGGTLRIRLRPAGNGVYHGTFAGRFAVVIPYFYRAEVYQVGNELRSTKQLGPFGEYRMSLQSFGESMQGSWSASGHHGTIQLRQRRGN